MSLSTPADISIQIVVPGPTGGEAKPLVSTERRLTPSWSVSTLKTKLEPITGIPSTSQLLRLAALDGSWLALDDDGAQLSSFPLRKGAVLEVVDTRPRGAQINWGNVSEVDKYVMTEEEYAKRNDSVMAWKKRQKLGRFDPSQKSVDQLTVERRQKDEEEVQEKGIQVGLRARVGKDDGKRGEVRWLGEVEGLGGARERGCVWVGVDLDEPVGRNDGSVEVEKEDGKGKVRLWEGKAKHGVLVRPEKVEVGDEWTVLDDLLDEDMEEV
ncbi:hypothetical protein DV735_g5864, partial [Chaetothyriales sp. CBS 134920]